MSQSTWTYVRNLPHLLFDSEFSIAILRPNALHYFTSKFMYRNSQTTMARILSLYKAPGNWLYSVVRPLLKGNVEIWQLCGKQ